MKLCFLDVETAGLTPDCAIVQIAGIIEIGGEVVEEFNFNPAPFPSDNVQAQALEISGRTLADVATGMPPKECHAALCAVLGRHVEKFDKADKMHFLAYNSPFDNGMVRAFFDKAGDRYFGSWFLNPDICIMRLAAARFIAGNRPPDMKLVTVGIHLGLCTAEEAEGAHDALWDIRLARAIFRHLQGVTL